MSWRDYLPNFLSGNFVEQSQPAVTVPDPVATPEPTGQTASVPTQPQPAMPVMKKPKVSMKGRSCQEQQEEQRRLEELWRLPLSGLPEDAETRCVTGIFKRPEGEYFVVTSQKPNGGYDRLYRGSSLDRLENVQYENVTRFRNGVIIMKMLEKDAYSEGVSIYTGWLSGQQRFDLQGKSLLSQMNAPKPERLPAKFWTKLEGPVIGEDEDGPIYGEPERTSEDLEIVAIGDEIPEFKFTGSGGPSSATSPELVPYKK